MNIVIPLGVGDGTTQVISGFVPGSRSLLSEEGGFRSLEGRVSLAGAVGQWMPQLFSVKGVGEEREVEGSRDSVLSPTLVLGMALSEPWGAGQDELVITMRGAGVPTSLLIPTMITFSLRQERKPFRLYFISLFTV